MLYHEVHGKYHPTIRAFLEKRGYYDIFLFSPQGDLVYSVFKELDYATNMNTGQWKDTDLANAFRAAHQSQEPGSVHFFDFKPYAPSYDAPASFISTPIHKDGQYIGVLVFQMPIGGINEIMQQTDGLTEKGEMFLIGVDGYYRSDSRFNIEGQTSILQKQLTNQFILDEVSNGVHGLVVAEHNDEENYIDYAGFEFHGKKFGVIATDNKYILEAPLRDLRKTIIFELIAFGVIGALLSFAMSYYLTKPLSQLTGRMKVIADGDYDVDVPAINYKDEVGDMARAVEILKQKGKEAEDLKIQQEEAERKAVQEKKEAMEMLANNFEGSVGKIITNVSAAVEELSRTAEGMSDIAKRTSDASGEVSSAATIAAQNVDTVASAAQELTASITEISEQVSQSSKIARESVERANETSETVGALSEVATKVGEVIGLINDIAEQTNLLALNATIEAARAGEAGKGFAVVATEVKNLAAQTTQATEEITVQIEKIQGSTKDTVNAVSTMRESIGKMDEIATSIATAVEEQSAATNEIARNVQETSSATQNVTENISKVSKDADETGEAAGQVVQASTELSEQISKTLNGEVQNFLKSIREG